MADILLDMIYASFTAFFGVAEMSIDDYDFFSLIIISEIWIWYVFFSTIILNLDQGVSIRFGDDAV